MARTIAFRGKEKGDFPYYIAKSLASNDFKVAVIDNSYAKDLFESVHQYNDEECLVEKENIVYIKDAVAGDGFLEKFDYVIYYLGLNENEQDTEYSFILSDYSSVNLHQVSDFGSGILKNSHFIMRDKVTNKVSEKAVARMLDINNEQILGYIPLDEKDETAYLNLNHTGRQKIKGTSKDMQYAVISALSIVTGQDIKTVRKYYRKAKRTRRF